jgi:hypothetical protein
MLEGRITMRRAAALVILASAALLLTSCGGTEVEWNADVEKAGFTEVDDALPSLRDAMTGLDETINRRISSSRYKTEALEDYKVITDFVDVLQFYYLPVLNARAMISRAYREVELGMYAEAVEDIGSAVDLVNKAALKSTESTKVGFDKVKESLLNVGEVSDATRQASLLKLSNTAKMLNILIEQINPVVVTTEEGESLIDGQMM